MHGWGYLGFVCREADESKEVVGKRICSRFKEDLVGFSESWTLIKTISAIQGSLAPHAQGPSFVGADLSGTQAKAIAVKAETKAAEARAVKDVAKAAKAKARATEAKTTLPEELSYKTRTPGAVPFHSAHERGRRSRSIIYAQLGTSLSLATDACFFVCVLVS